MKKTKKSLQKTSRVCTCGKDITCWSGRFKKCILCRKADAPTKTCGDCGESFRGLWARRCDVCTKVRYVFRVYGSGQTLAVSEVAKARNRKDLLPAYDHKCVDCGADALEYDHRDYSKPLDVEPVCKSCNCQRKSAKPKNWSFDEFMTYYKGLLSNSVGPHYFEMNERELCAMRNQYFGVAS